MKKATILGSILVLLVLLMAYGATDTASAASDYATTDHQLTETTVSTTATLFMTAVAQGNQPISDNQGNPQIAVPDACNIVIAGFGLFGIPIVLEGSLCHVISFG
jgi:hypothetical protein